MSDDLYCKVGALLEDDLFLSTVASPKGEPTQAANILISLYKNGVGSISTTGVTLSNVPGANGTEVIHLSANPTTSFVSAVGEYTAIFTWTTDTTYEFTKTYRVNTMGNPSGTYGDLSFTATAADGRVTDDSSVPLQNAQVFIRTPAGALYDMQTTDASGLWGPTYIPSTMTGTWPISATLSGYATVQSSLTVSSTAITGPGIDLELTAVSVGSGMTLAELMTYGRLQIRDNLGAKANAMLISAINDALANLAKAHGAQWNWLKSISSININPYYATGTLALVYNTNTAVLSGGTWPTYANNGLCKLFLSGKWYRVASIAGLTATLSDTYYEATNATAGYVLFQDTYTLAADCLRFGRMFPGMFWGDEPQQNSYETILEWYNTHLNSLNYPRCYGIANNNRVIIYPYPTTNHDIRYLYYRKPAVLSSPTDEADWDPMHLEVLQRAIDHQLAIRFGSVLAGSVTETLNIYDIVLKRAMATDKDSPKRPGLIRGNQRPDISDRRLPSV